MVRKSKLGFMKQIHGLNFLKEQKENRVNLGKKAYEEEMEELCTEYIIPLLKKYVTDETKTPLLVRALKTFDEHGCTDRSNLTEEEEDLNFTLYLRCLMYTRDNEYMIKSNLREETKIDLIVHEFVNSDIENLLYRHMTYED